MIIEVSSKEISSCIHENRWIQNNIRTTYNQRYQNQTDYTLISFFQMNFCSSSYIEKLHFQTHWLNHWPIKVFRHPSDSNPHKRCTQSKFTHYLQRTQKNFNSFIFKMTLVKYSGRFSLLYLICLYFGIVRQISVIT